MKITAIISKGMWVDDEWMLLTGNNLNLVPGVWIQNAIPDPRSQHDWPQRERELELIRTYDGCSSLQELQSIADYQ